MTTFTKIFKSSLLALLVLGTLFASSAGPSFAATATKTTVAKPKTVATQPAVKKSVNNLCHAKGTKYYNQTKKFKAYKTIKDCLKSGGKLPKK